MLYGQLKTSSESFFDDHQNAIFGGLKGIITGGLIGGIKDVAEHERSTKKKLKNIGVGAAIGGVAGTGLGSFLDQKSVQDNLRRYVDDAVRRATEK